MVYWGCGTDRNRFAWLWVGLAGSTGAALFIMGAAKLDACHYLQSVLQECSLPPKAMLIAGAALMVMALPPLLFFNGCASPPLDQQCKEVSSADSQPRCRSLSSPDCFLDPQLPTTTAPKHQPPARLRATPALAPRRTATTRPSPSCARATTGSRCTTNTTPRGGSSWRRTAS